MFGSKPLEVRIDTSIIEHSNACSLSLNNQQDLCSRFPVEALKPDVGRNLLELLRHLVLTVLVREFLELKLRRSAIQQPLWLALDLLEIQLDGNTIHQSIASRHAEVRSGPSKPNVVLASMNIFFSLQLCARAVCISIQEHVSGICCNFSEEEFFNAMSG